jgi:hypothetical protein
MAKKHNHIVEIVEISGRKFHIYPTHPDDKNTSWTFLEEVSGELIKPKDIMVCYTPKSFVAHHIKSSLEIINKV